MPRDLDEQAIAGRRPRGTVRHFDEIASTNTEALEWANAEAPDGSLVVANHQTGGRGRWGRSWFSLPGKLVQFSMIVRPQLELDRHGLLTGGLGVACADAIALLTGLPTKVKWPNDVVVDDRKIAGLLVETQTIGDRITAAICGIGVNVSLVEGDLPEELRTRASSIAIELERRSLGETPARGDLLIAIVEKIEALLPRLSDPRRHEEIVGAMREWSAILGAQVTIRDAGGVTVTGRAAQFSNDGALVLATSDGERVVHVGEIEQLRER